MRSSVFFCCCSLLSFLKNAVFWWQLSLTVPVTTEQGSTLNISVCTSVSGSQCSQRSLFIVVQSDQAWSLAHLADTEAFKDVKKKTQHPTRLSGQFQLVLLF